MGSAQGIQAKNSFSDRIASYAGDSFGVHNICHQLECFFRCYLPLLDGRA
jgi:hypothetical protein